MRVGHTEVCCQSSTMIIALVALHIDPCHHPVLWFPRKKNTRRDDVGCLSDTPDRSIFDRGAGRFRVHRRSFSIPFRARRFRDRFLVSPTVVFRRVPKKKQTVDADGLLTRTCLHVPVARWAGGCLRERHEEDWRVIVPAVIRRSRARRDTLPRASPSLRDPHATGSGRASVRGSSGSRTARLESVRRFDKLEADCASRRRRGSPRRTSRDMLPSMVRRYAAARRKQTRSQRLQAR